MNTDQQIYTLLGADPEFLAILTDGIIINSPYHFEAIEVKGLDRRSDGMLLPENHAEPIWVIEFQAQEDATIYHRIIIEMGLIGERNLHRMIQGLILFTTEAIDPKTKTWFRITQQSDSPLRIAYLHDILDRLEQQHPQHPLLAAFLPYRINDQERLQSEVSEAYNRIQYSNLSIEARTCLNNVFLSWLTIRFNKLSYREVLQMFGNLTPLEQTRFYQDVVAIGMEKGLEKGRELEACNLILRQARRRFGELPTEIEQHIQTLPLPRLEALAEVIIDFKKLNELHNWLKKL